MAEKENYRTNGSAGIFDGTGEQLQASPNRITSAAMDRPEDTRKSSSNARDEFVGAVQPLQVKIPADLIQSLKLHAIADGKTMSELVLQCLTSDATISKAWIATRTSRSKRAA